MKFKEDIIHVVEGSTTGTYRVYLTGPRGRDGRFSSPSPPHPARDNLDYDALLECLTGLFAEGINNGRKSPEAYLRRCGIFPTPPA